MGRAFAANKDQPELIRKMFVLSLLLLFFFTGCQSVKNPALLSSQTSLERPHPVQEYRIQIGDQLDIKFFYNPELNEQVTVRPDGRISLQLVQEVAVAGLTPSGLTNLLSQRYASKLNKPEIAVIVRSFGSQRIYVDGEVAKPGLFPLVGVTTALQAIAQAGGMKETARVSQVVIIRRGEQNRPVVFQVDLGKAIDSTDTSQDMVLKPFDVVFVPRSAISNINVWIDQYIRKNIPINTGFGFTYNLF